MNNQFALYKIHQEIEDLIESYIDPETGEISEMVNAHFSALQLRREDAIHQIGLYGMTNASKSEAVNNEIKRLQAIKKTLDIREAISKKILVRELAEGETFEFDNLVINWRKSETVEIDPTMDIEELSLTQPDLVKISYEIKKAEVKKFVKNGKPIPKGLMIIKKNNLQVK
jgi:hypothetical protein